VQRFGRFGFYAVFALAVTASVQVVGVYLVFSSLIIPALGTLGYQGPRRYARAYGLGAGGYALGLALSALLDLPSGALIVWTLAACAIVLSLLTRTDPRPSELVLGLGAQGGSGRSIIEAEQQPGVVLEGLMGPQTHAPEQRRAGDV
jgi:hypothetical protein